MDAAGARPVALILSDYQMPRMDGVEFLRAATEMMPEARRALLSTYADTEAAAAAVGVVDVDDYLSKPWEPPEEKLYPAVDRMLAGWRRQAGPPGPQD